MVPGKKSKNLFSAVEVMPAWKWYILPVVESQKERDESMKKYDESMMKGGVSRCVGCDLKAW